MFWLHLILERFWGVCVTWTKLLILKKVDVKNKEHIENCWSASSDCAKQSFVLLEMGSITLLAESVSVKEVLP